MPDTNVDVDRAMELLHEFFPAQLMQGDYDIPPEARNRKWHNTYVNARLHCMYPGEDEFRPSTFYLPLFTGGDRDPDNEASLHLMYQFIQKGLSIRVNEAQKDRIIQMIKEMP